MFRDSVNEFLTKWFVIFCMPYSVLVFLLTALMNTIFPSSSETGRESLPSTRQPRITFFYCAEFLKYENLIKGEGMESLRYIRVGSNITVQQYQTQSKNCSTLCQMGDKTCVALHRINLTALLLLCQKYGAPLT